MAGIFGTDGVRALINTGSMRAESVVRLALAAGRWFADKTADDGRMTRPMVVIGKDTRLSGYMLESCLLYTSPSPRDVEESRMPSSA